MGILDGEDTEIPVSVSDCIQLGKQAVADDLYALAVDWFEEAEIILEEEEESEEEYVPAPAKKSAFAMLGEEEEDNNDDEDDEELGPAARMRRRVRTHGRHRQGLVVLERMDGHVLGAVVLEDPTDLG